MAPIVPPICCITFTFIAVNYNAILIISGTSSAEFQGFPKESYIVDKRNADRVIDAAQIKAHNSKFANIHMRDQEKHELFKLSKQMCKAKLDVESEQCIKDEEGALACTVESQTEAWRSNFDCLLGTEFDWDRDSFPWLII